MKENKTDKTVSYDPSADLDGILATYEKTSTEEPSDISHDEKKEEKSPEPAKKKRALNIFIIILCSLVAAGLIVLCLFYFGIIDFKKDYGVAVRRTDGTVFLCSSGEPETDHTVVTHKLSENGELLAYTDNAEHLYYLKTRRFSRKKSTLISDSVENEYHIFADRFVIFKNDNNYYYFDTEKDEKKLLAEGVSNVLIPHTGSCFFFVKDKKEIYLFSADNGSSLLCKNASFFELYDDSVKTPMLIYGEKIGENKKIYCCDGEGKSFTLCDGATDYYCGEKDKVWDNFYYFKKGKSSVSIDITFSDEYADTDAAMKEPKESDYQKSIMFGLINYTEGERYKKAYIEYQEKLARDKVREFAKNYVSGKTSGECADVYAFSSGGSIKVGENIEKINILAYCPGGSPKIIFRKTNTVVSANLEIADIAKEIGNGDSQEDFNAFVDSKLMSRKFSDGIYISDEKGEKGITLDIPDGCEKLEYSPDGLKIFAWKTQDEKQSLTVFDAVSGKKEAVINDCKNTLFVSGIYYLLKYDGTLSCCKSAGGFADIMKMADNVSEIKIMPDGAILSLSKGGGSLISAGYIKGENYLSVCENAEDFYYRNADEIFFIKDKKLYILKNSKAEIIAENASEILK